MGEESPRVSVITPAYQVAPGIGETLGSVLAQTMADWKAIGVNDGSPDSVAYGLVLWTRHLELLQLVRSMRAPPVVVSEGAVP